jgi:hypothetical protein
MKLEEIKDRTKEAADYLVQSLEAGHSEVLAQYLGAIAKFHTYSFGNIMLIVRQKPSATTWPESAPGTRLAASFGVAKKALALTQDLRMDFVLDALLQSLTDLISCDCARIWLLEGDTRLFVAREKVRRETSKKASDLSLNARRRGYPLCAKNPWHLAGSPILRYETRARLANVHWPYSSALMALRSSGGLPTHPRSPLGRPQPAR